LASTAIARVGLAAFATSTLVAVAPVLAAGGDGGGNPGSGGPDSTTAVGGNGTAGGAAGQGGGGGGTGIGPGGGGSGTGGGAGGAGGNGAAGGTAGTQTTAGGDGDPGAAAGDGGGGGGGGGVGVNAPLGGMTGGNFTASAGGSGGDGNGTGAGGGGGAGGVNIILGSGTQRISVTNQRLGGAGGAGGASAAGLGGSGGSGGAGIIASGGTVNMDPGSLVGGGAGGAAGVGGAGTGVGGAGGAGISATSATINNDGATISGGGGGAGSTNGAGGAGIIGQDLAIVTSGSISGGLAGDGVTRANAISFTGGTNTLQFGNATSGLTGAISVTGSVDFNQAVTSTTVSNNIIGTGSVIKSNSGVITLSGTSTYTGGTTITAGTLAVTDDANLGNVAGVLTFNGGTLRVSTSGGPVVVLARDVSLQAGGGTVEAEIGTILSGQITGAGSLTKTGSEILSLFGTNTYTGATNVMSGQLQSDSAGAFSAASAFTVAAGAAIELRGSQQSIGSLAGAGDVMNFNVAAATLTTGFDNSSTTFSGVISDNVGLLSLVKVGSGTQTLSGVNTYGGTTTVNGGTLAVNGSIATSPLTTVNAGGTLGGTGTVGNTTINGGTLSPGNSIGTLAVAGNLVFTAAASYMVEVSPASSDRTNVTGAATLGGATVKASFAAGAYVVKQYTILNAAGGLAGSAFGSVVNTNLPGGFTSSLSYDANNAYLNLALAFVPPPGTGLNINQQNVGNAIVNFFNTTGGIPIVFGGLTPAGLTQISGEVGSAPQQTTFNAMNQFMGVMTDPFIAGRGDPIGARGAPNAYADESMAYAASGKGRTQSARDAYAAIYTKAPPLQPTFEQRWSMWGAAFGGSQRTDGNAVVGSNDTRSSLYGIAVGADYRFSPNTLAGFAIAGGGTNFSVANNLGGGRSDLFQAGVFLRHNAGPAYLTGALAYGWQDVMTDRTVTVAGIDRLRAEFNANAWSGRIEGGYRFVTQGLGFTPYAAGQFTTFELPAYAEQAVVGANTFALAYNSKSVTSTRSELGLRTDKSFAMQDGILTLRGRAAWAHDFNPDRAIAATFQTLPGASFVVNGAAMAADSALVTGSAEMKWLNGWSAAATFEGEFSSVTRSYAGKGVVRYAW
jgi:autotransporter-associated beta strand protein